MPYLPSYVVPDYVTEFEPWGQYLNHPSREAYGSASKLLQAVGLPDPSQLSGGDALGLVQEYAPTVAQLIKGLTPQEQQAVLTVKIENLQKYTGIPLIGEFAKDRIKEYQARLAVLPDLIEREEKRAKTMQLVATMGVVALGAISISALASAVKKVRS